MITLGLTSTHLCRPIILPDVWRSDPRSPYWGDVIRVSQCECGIRTEEKGGGFSRPSEEGFALVEEIFVSHGRPSPFDNIGTTGSGWVMELPACISYIIDKKGMDAAREALKEAWRVGSSSVVTKPLMGY